MKKLVCFTLCNNEAEIYFDSCFPNEMRITVEQKELRRLAKLLCRLGERGRGFVWKSKVSGDMGGFVFKITGNKAPSLTFEYKMLNHPFNSVSDCENFYDRISFEGILQFGEELGALENKKEAALYECTPLPQTTYFKEYANKII